MSALAAYILPGLADDANMAVMLPFKHLRLLLSLGIYISPSIITFADILNIISLSTWAVLGKSFSQKSRSAFVMVPLWAPTTGPATTGCMFRGFPDVPTVSRRLWPRAAKTSESQPERSRLKPLALTSSEAGALRLNMDTSPSSDRRAAPEASTPLVSLSANYHDRLVWAGRVVKPVFNSANDECALQCEPIFTLLKRAGLRRNYQILCPYTLYDHRCGLQMPIFGNNDVVTSASSNRIGGTRIASMPEGILVGEILRMGSALRLIYYHKGGEIQVAGNIPGLKVGSAIQVIDGFGKILKTCFDYFQNYLNFGGFPYMSTKNPFAGDALCWLGDKQCGAG